MTSASGLSTSRGIAVTMARSSGSDGSDSASLPLPRQKSFDIDLEAMMNSLYSE